MPQIRSPWQQHVADWKHCTRCDLSSTCNHIVLARGKIPCDVMFLGEAPGPSEDVLGQPFVGPAGKLLDSLIRQAGFNLIDHDVEQVRIVFTNLVGCMPLDEGGVKFAEPPKYAIEKCTPRVRHMIELAKPKAIVVVGTLAKRWLPKILGTQYNEYEVVEIIHPAAILRADVTQQGLAMQRTVVTLNDLITGPLFHQETQRGRPKRR